MSAPSSQPVPPEPSSPPSSGGVRRHHTISASSRATRAGARDYISEDPNQEYWNEDEIVGDNWVGGVGAVGEKTSLHRQSSLPTRYHRAFQASASKTGAMAMTPAMPGLTAIAGNENDEDDWEREIENYAADEDSTQDSNDQQNNNLPYGAGPPDVPSPPPAASAVRRHVSLTYGAQGGARPKMAGLKRSGTLQTPLPPHPATPPESTTPTAPEEEEYEYYEDPDEDYYGKQSQGNEWRTPGSTGSTGSNSNFAIDDVSRALNALEISNNNNSGGYSPYQTGGQNAYPPRFNPAQAQTSQSPGPRNGRKLQALAADFDPRGLTQSTNAYQQQYQQQSGSQQPWNQKDHALNTRSSNSNMQYGYQQSRHGKSASGSSASGLPDAPSIPQQYLQQQQSPRANFSQTAQQSSGSSQSGYSGTPVDVPSLIAAKGYNPSNFDIKPPFARFFVIKSYTEDDVHKSLKYEIWSSTDPGNKRLDKAFKDCAGRGPIYLFFSVNASGHFCGMAEMLTPVDYTRSSNVWASDKWKGVFKVRWVFVRDIPNGNLRHIKLNNTQERKPVTNSRDTQELLPDAGQEMLRIFFTHPARTSLLQDFAFYELQAMQKIQAQSGASSPVSTSGGGMNSPPLPSISPIQQSPQQNMFSGNPNALGYQMPQMTPMMQMQLQMGMNLGVGNQYGMAQQGQSMQQSVMRQPSPGPGNNQGQGYMGGF